MTDPQIVRFGEGGDLRVYWFLVHIVQDFRGKGLIAVIAFTQAGWFIRPWVEAVGGNVNEAAYSALYKPTDYKGPHRGGRRAILLGYATMSTRKHGIVGTKTNSPRSNGPRP
jgi:hypothetical protein